MVGKPDHWTPRAVEENAVAAMKWLNEAVAQVGPRGFRSAMPAFVPTLEDHLAEGWGFPERAVADEKELRIPASPAQIARHEYALSWVRIYVQPIDVEMARCLNAWFAVRARKGSFPRIVKERGLKRTRAYGLKDKGLSIISTRLESRGIPVWR